MDELYNNAWGDPSDSFNDENDASASHRAWVPPVLPTQHEEADLAAPSWSTGADIKWNEPSEHHGGFTWTSAEPDLAWGTSTYEDITLGKAEAAPVPDQPAITVSEQEASVADEGAEHSTPELSLADSLGSVDRHSSPHSVSEHNSRSVSPDNDGFGTFEDALIADAAPQSSKFSPAFEDEGETWGSPWAAAPAEEEDEEAEPADEWEIARRNKERMDRVVVCHLLHY